ncbi:hypothetical protein [Wolbachia endosymbiont (group A) of Andrena hattorfiana]|uniref:hypothetical protein n=1 Tax=Wolbachia endosymbiont (group A) of Andrena hattorfiana TaxID=2953977 RepID=UPI0021F82144|nr:hypothetical protein [Wolbachia endosymbiont (group A) of Andrena hattorfiana]
MLVCLLTSKLFWIPSSQGTGMTGEGGYLNDILPCGLKSQRSYSYGGMIWKNL